MQSSPPAELTPVLMLVPFFAPQSHAAMFRAHKLAKYLPQYGYRPIVVTVDTNYIYNEDDSLLAELPAEVEIHRARYIEPSMRGIRMALGGSDRRFAALKASNKQAMMNRPASAGGNSLSKLPSLGGLVAKLIGSWPDRYWTWTGSAEALARRLIRQHGIQLIYSSANPTSFLRAVTRLKRDHDLIWLFDSRDPLGYGQKNSAPHFLARVLEQRILTSAIANADHVSGLSNVYGQIFFDLYGLDESRWTFIPTGLDEGYLPSTTSKSLGRNLLHVGEVMPNQSRHCFETLEKILEQSDVEPPFDQLIFVGRCEVNEPIVRKMTADMPLLATRLCFLDHRPQIEVYELMRTARACLLVPGQTRYWWTNFAKLVDYIGLSVPVIAHVPPVSEARYELEKAGTAFFLGTDVEQDSVALSHWLATEPPQANVEYCNRYTAKRQVQTFAELFNYLLTRVGRG